MPNPLIQVRRNTSKNKVDRPTPITPAMESVEGDNHPYRGTEIHGVEDNAHPHDPETYGFDVDDPNADGGRNFQPIPEHEHTPEPVPVYVVRGADEPRQEKRTFGTDRIGIDNTTANNIGNRAVELLGRSEARFNVKVVNLDATNWLLIGSTREETLMRGYPLLPGKEWTSTCQDPIFVMAVTPTFGQPTTVLNVAYTTEYAVAKEF